MSSQLLGGVLAVVHLVHVLSVQYARADRHVDSVCFRLGRDLRGFRDRFHARADLKRGAWQNANEMVTSLR